MSNKPIKPEDIDVSVEPVEKPIPNDRESRRNGENEKVGRQNRRNKDFAEKVEKQLDADVKKAAEDAKGGGRKAQREAIEKTVERVAGDLPKEQIKEVVVTVDGDGSTAVPAGKGEKP